MSKSNGGFKVATLSARDAAQLYDYRIALEQLSVKDACEQITSKQLKQLEKYVLLAEKSQSSKPDPLKLLEIDYRFHHLIAESSGNQWLLAILERVFDKMALLRVQTTKHNPQVLEIRLEHREVYQAIALRDSDLAQATVKLHLMSAKARVARVLEIIQNTAK